MNHEKLNKILTTVMTIVILLVACLIFIFGFGTLQSANAALDEYTLNEKIDIEATPETATLETATSEDATSEDIDDTEIDSIEHFNTLNVYEDSGVLKIKDSTVKLTSSDGKKVELDVKIPTADYTGTEPCTIQYQDTLDGCVLAGVINVKLDNEETINYGVGRFTTEDGSEVVTGRKVLEDDLSIQATAVSNDEYSGERLQKIIKYLVDSAEVVDDTSNVAINICGMTVKDPANTSIILTKDILEVNTNGTKVYVSPYNTSLTGSGLDKSMKIGEVTLKYGDLKDSATGYMPFVVNNDYGDVKVSAQSSDVLNSLFS